MNFVFFVFLLLFSFVFVVVIVLYFFPLSISLTLWKILLEHIQFNVHARNPINICDNLL